MPTIKDVAKLAGVSTATVSSVLSGRRFVSPHLAAEVRRAVDALGYRPNAVARSLRDQRTMTIGVSVPDITNPFFNGIVRAVDAVADAAGYQVLLVSNEERPDVERKRVETLVARQVDGLVIVPSDDEVVYAEYLQRQRVPTVFVDRGSARLPFDLVTVDNVAAAYAATRYLVSLGHRRIAALATSNVLRNIRERLNGFRGALRDADLPVDERLVVAPGLDVDAGVDAARALLATEPGPTAVFCLTNRMARSAMRAMHALALNVPRDVSLLTFDDVDWATAMEPELTTVAQPLDELGRQAFSVLKARMDGDDGPVQRPALECRLVVRASTTPPPQTTTAQSLRAD
jgi:LacI family transcriptional regulator